MDMVDEKWEWRRKVGVAYGKWAWLMKNIVWLRRCGQTRALREVYRVFPVCVCVCVCATRGSTAQTSKPISMELGEQVPYGWECARLSFTAEQPPIAMQRPKNRVHYFQYLSDSFECGETRLRN